MPPPTITLRGGWSLNRKNSPGRRARKFAADGAQKLTSARFGCCRSMSNQSPSVTAMTRLMAILFRCLHFAILGRRQGFGQQRVEQPAAAGSGGGETRFQAVAQRHQLIDLDDDAVLFSEGWERNVNASKSFQADFLMSCALCDFNDLRSNFLRANSKIEEPSCSQPS